jgi:hypothetical protein
MKSGSGWLAADGGHENWIPLLELCNMLAGNFKNKFAGLGRLHALPPP